MNELSLFTGAGGGVLGTKLLGWTTIGYVEYEKYCQQIIKQRIKDGIFDNAPIFGDIRTFIGDGYAESYSGMVDVISAGFPCQPFSVAGKQKGADDERNMWPATLECIRIIRPRYAFLENVGGLVTSGYFGTILRGLVESGYNCKWRILSAAEMGAPHKRDRLWILAYSANHGSYMYDQAGISKGEFIQDKNQPGNRRASGLKGCCSNVGNTTSERLQKSRYSQRQEAAKERKAGMVPKLKRSSSDLGNTKEIGSQGLRANRQQGPQAHVGQGLSVYTSGGAWRHDPAEAEAESGVGRVAHGVANRVDRLKAIGNGQVPQVARTAWELLTESE